MSKIIQMKTTPDMIQAIDQMEISVSKAAGLFDLLTFSATQDRSSYGSPSTAAANGIGVLSDSITEELEQAFLNVSEAYGAELREKNRPTNTRQPA